MILSSVVGRFSTLKQVFVVKRMSLKFHRDDLGSKPRGKRQLLYLFDLEVLMEGLWSVGAFRESLALGCDVQIMVIGSAGIC